MSRRDEDAAVGSEATFSLTLQPSNQPTTNSSWSDTYIGIRVRLDHKYLKPLMMLFDDVPDWACYQHKAGTNNEHFHLCLPGAIDNARQEKFRKRIRTKYGGDRSTICCKGYSNGLHSYVFYNGHEGTEAIYDDPRWADVIQEQLKKEQPYLVKQQKIDTHFKPGEALSDREKMKNLRDWQVTYTNLVPLCVRHRQEFSLKSDDLRYVAGHMFQNTRWKPCNQMRRMRVSRQYQEDFEFRIGKREHYNMDWFWSGE